MSYNLVESSSLYALQWKAYQWDSLQYRCTPSVFYLANLLILAVAAIIILKFLLKLQKREALFFMDLCEDLHMDIESKERRRYSIQAIEGGKVRDIINSLCALAVDTSIVNTTKETTRDLIYYDQPILFIGRNEAGQLVIANLAEENEIGRAWDYFFAALPEESDAQDFADEKISLLDLYKKQTTMYICQGVWRTMSKAYSVASEEIPESILPTEGSFIGFDLKTVDTPEDIEEAGG